MKKTFFAAALTALPLLAWADGQASIKADSQTNLGSTYTAGTAKTLQSAYSGAATTAGTIAQQDSQNAQQMYGVWQTDLSNAAYYQSQAASAQAAANSASDQTAADQYAQQAQGAANQAAYWSNRAQQDGDAYQAWLDAANQAQATSGQQTDLSNEQGALAQQSAQTQQSSYDKLVNNDVPQAQSDIAAQASQADAQQGQPTVTNNTGEYLIAGAATQAAMNGLTVTGFTANKTAYQDAQNAASCGNPYCAAAWMAANAVEQNIANAAYASNVAAAPVLGTALNAAAAASALNSAKGTLQQIQSMTGVTQGQTAGSTNTQQALAQTTLQTGVQQGQSATASSTDTSYTNAADAQQAALGVAAQQNQNAAVTAAQAGIAGLNAEYSRNAANQIASYDNAQAQSTGDPTWAQAAGIAQQQVDLQQGIYSDQQNIQNQAITTGNTTAAQENALSSSIGSTLNTAAQNAASTQANTTLQNIGAQTGVPQGQ